MPAFRCCNSSRLKCNVADDDFAISSLISAIWRVLLFTLGAFLIGYSLSNCTDYTQSSGTKSDKNISDSESLNCTNYQTLNNATDSDKKVLDLLNCTNYQTQSSGTKRDSLLIHHLLMAFVIGSTALHLILVLINMLLVYISGSGKLQYSRSRTLKINVLISIEVMAFLPELLFIILGYILAGRINSLEYRESLCNPSIYRYLLAYNSVIIITIILHIMFSVILLDPCGCCTFGGGGLSICNRSNEMKNIYHFDPEPNLQLLEQGGHNSSVTPQHSKTCSSLKRTATNDYKLFQSEAVQLWYHRLSTLTHSHTSSVGNPITEAAKLFGTLFKDTDYVLSDLLVAVLLTSRHQKLNGKYQQRECLRRVTGLLTQDQFLKGRYEYRPPTLWSSSDTDDLRELSEVIYYYNYAMGIYGWPLYVLDSPCKGLCKLACKASLLCCTEGRKLCCNCSRAAFHIQVPNCGTKDVIHCSKQNEFYETPYYVVLDHHQKAVIITIRGTLSMKDVVTCLQVSLHPIKIDHPELKNLNNQIHKGWDYTARYILFELRDENILEKALSDNPDYSLVIVGHSLGGAVASVLSLYIHLYEEKWAKKLKCFGYSTPGCVFSYSLATYTKQFITTIVLKNDIFPRLNWRSLLFLKKSLVKQLNHCQKSKLEILFRDSCFLCHQKQSFSNMTDDEDSNDDVIKTVYENPQWEELGDFAPEYENASDQLSCLAIAVTAAKSAQRKRLKKTLARGRLTFSSIERQAKPVVCVPAFVPGKVLQIDQTDTISRSSCCHTRPQYTMHWKANEEYSYIQLEGSPLTDHLPASLREALESISNDHLDANPTFPIEADDVEQGLRASHRPSLLTTTNQLDITEEEILTFENNNCSD